MATNMRGAQDYTLDEGLAEAREQMGRRDYAGAGDLCRRLLGDYPASAELHALIGDAAGAQGEWSEAVENYELALELDFDADVMEKLATARSHAIRGDTTPAPAPAGAPRSSARTSPAMPRHQVVGLAALGVLVISLLLYLVVISLSGPSAEDEASIDSAAIAASTPRYTTPTPSAQQRSAGAPVHATGASPAPGYSSPATSQPLVRYTGQARPQQQTASGGGASGAGELSSSRDRRILHRMSMDKWTDGTTVSKLASIAVDEFTGGGILTISAPRTRDASQLERDVTTAAFRAAVSAMRADAALTGLVIRCVSRGSQSGEEDLVVFRATANRPTLEPWLSGDSAPSFGQIKSSILTNIRWDKTAVDKHIKRSG